MPELYSFSPVKKLQKSQKSLYGHAKRFLWAEADLFRTAFPMIFWEKPSMGGNESRRNYLYGMIILTSKIVK